MSRFMDKMIAKKRKELADWLEERKKVQPIPENVTILRDIPYLEDGAAEHRMDIYYPTGNQQKLPVIVNVHGGGLVMGCKEFNRCFCAHLCEMGFVVFSLEYALVPEVQVSRQLADVTAGMEAVKERLAAYHGDPEHVYMVGDSAGAYLIVYAVAMQKSPTLAKEAGAVPSALPVKALGLISGMFYTNKRDEIGIFLPSLLYGENRKNYHILGRTPEQKEVIGVLPPCYLMTSHNDMLHRYTVWFAKGMENQRKVYKLVDYPKNKKLTHAFSTFYPEWEESKRANKAMVKYLLQF